MPNKPPNPCYSGTPKKIIQIKTLHAKSINGKPALYMTSPAMEAWQKTSTSMDNGSTFQQKDIKTDRCQHKKYV